jgi:hypothetical protein
MLSQQISALCTEALREAATLAAGLTDEQRSACGSAAAWSAKDVFAHLAVWQRQKCDDLAGAPRKPIADEEIDAINGAIFERCRAWSWDQVWREEEDSMTALAKAIAAMREEDLRVTDRYPWQDGRALWKNLAGTGYTHAIVHLANLYSTLGQNQRGLDLMVGSMEALRGLDPDPEWQGNLTYNIACQHALAGDRTRALTFLTEGLRLAPNLRSWARQDPDLVCLRGYPEFSALTGG